MFNYSFVCVLCLLTAMSIAIHYIKRMHFLKHSKYFSKSFSKKKKVSFYSSDVLLSSRFFRRTGSSIHHYQGGNESQFKRHTSHYRITSSKLSKFTFAFTTTAIIYLRPCMNNKENLWNKYCFHIMHMHKNRGEKKKPSIQRQTEHKEKRLLQCDKQRTNEREVCVYNMMKCNDEQNAK